MERDFTGDSKVGQPNRVIAVPESLFGSLYGLLTLHRELLWELVKRELSDRYAGQWLGALWVVAHPLLMMAVYVFIFAYVLQVRMDESRAMSGDYTTYILSGLIPWLAFQEAMNRSCGAVLSQASLVKQMVFPVEVLPIKVVLAACVTPMIAFAVLGTYVFATKQAVPASYAFLPLLFFIQLVGMVGVGFLLSAVSVYFRDLKEIVQVFGVIGAFFMPVFYLPDWVPSVLQPFLYLNPFSYFIWCYQDLLFFGRVEHWWAWVVAPVFSSALLYLGYRTFRTLKTMFANVL